MLWHNHTSFPVGRATKVYFTIMAGSLELKFEFILSQVNPDAILAASLIEEGILKTRLASDLQVLKTSENCWRR